MFLSKNLRRSTRTEIIRIEKQSGLDELRSVFSGVEPLRGAGTGCAGMQSGQESDAGAARFHAAGFIRLHVLCVWLEVPLRYAVWETVRVRFQRGTGLGLR